MRYDFFNSDSNSDKKHLLEEKGSGKLGFFTGLSGGFGGMLTASESWVFFGMLAASVKDSVFESWVFFGMLAASVKDSVVFFCMLSASVKDFFFGLSVKLFFVLFFFKSLNFSNLCFAKA